MFFLFQIVYIKLEDMMKNTIYVPKFLLFLVQCFIGSPQLSQLLSFKLYRSAGMKRINMQNLCLNLVPYG